MNWENVNKHVCRNLSIEGKRQYAGVLQNALDLNAFDSMETMQNFIESSESVLSKWSLKRKLIILKRFVAEAKKFGNDEEVALLDQMMVKVEEKIKTLHCKPPSNYRIAGDEVIRKMLSILHDKVNEYPLHVAVIMLALNGVKYEDVHGEKVADLMPLIKEPSALESEAEHSHIMYAINEVADESLTISRSALTSFLRKNTRDIVDGGVTLSDIRNNWLIHLMHEDFVVALEKAGPDAGKLVYFGMKLVNNEHLNIVGG